MGLNNSESNLTEALNSLVKNMANEKQRYIESKEKKNQKEYSEEHPIIKSKKAIDDVANRN